MIKSMLDKHDLSNNKNCFSLLKRSFLCYKQWVFDMTPHISYCHMNPS